MSKIMMDSDTIKNKRTLVTGVYIKTYVYMFNAAQLSIEEAKSEQRTDVVFYKCMTAIVFLAFCLEAYLNHLGAELIENWEDDFKRLSPRGKLRLLMSKYGKVNLNTHPFQSFSKIFEVRNQLAHGKTVWVAEKYPKEPRANWEKSCNITNVEKLCNDTEKMIRVVHAKITSNHDVNPFLPGFKFSGFIQE
jgi:hypothetical protein